jgi:hypothetical protein
MVAARRGATCEDVSVTEPSRDDVAELLLSQAREELIRADGKASLLLAAAGIAISAVAGAGLNGAWGPSYLDLGGQWVWWIGVVLEAAGMVRLGQAVYPRTRRRGPTTLLGYYADVARISPDELDKALQLDLAAKRALILDQLGAISVIVVNKYRYVAQGMWLIASGVLAWGLAAIVG